MTEKFLNRYRIASTRLQNWDYAWPAAYFITICTKNMECIFGNIENSVMIISDIGKIVQNEWIKTFDMRPDMNLSMDEYVIMPNHFHADIIIGKNRYNLQRGRDAMHCVSTNNKFGPQSKNLASIIRGFKIGVTKNVRQIHTDFEWQPRSYDRIIRDQESFERIRNYIINNPVNWDRDKFNRK